MEFHVYENARAACEAAGVLIAAQITRKGDSVLGLATGSTPIPAYEMLAQWYDRGVIDFDRVRTFNLDEYVGIDHKNPLSYHAFMQEHLFSKVNLRKENVHLPSGNAAADAEAYDRAIHAAGGIDIQLLGIGRNGHIGFNEPADDFTYGTHVVTPASSGARTRCRVRRSPWASATSWRRSASCWWRRARARRRPCTTPSAGRSRRACPRRFCSSIPAA